MKEKGRARLSTLRRLFTSSLYISSFTFGGGFVIVTFMKKRFVDELGWLTEEEMLDLTAIAQSCPGSIAVNAAILVGQRMAGAAGIAAAVLGTLLPPMVLLSLISVFYEAFSANRYVSLALHGMQAGAAAIILDVAFTLGEKVLREHSLFSALLLAASFLLSLLFGVNAALLLLLAAGIGVMRFLLKKRKEERS